LVVTWPPPGKVAPLVKVTTVLGGKFSIEQATTTLGPVEGTAVGLQVKPRAC
jgi:hypothetical protein